jgi:Xaa-Pro dipeptidase
MVLTIEPGLYFIDSLIQPWRLGPMAQHFNFVLIDELMPSGGIRIEDNILVTHSGHRNLTREYLP